ncbi:hypothetical protein QTH91_03825 [Variovorax dokdonensis]|uniref:Uncharacterized protein n=1 Tax=Variovorax dokdonensis TaxID=344883 RepID=A0ABT7N6N5_9BURK|nr:hypothetical protein [Variovorax dokdonensis]MDM0043601.1 hypothetical protein [Variovorax dokdonensis]
MKKLLLVAALAAALPFSAMAQSGSTSGTAAKSAKPAPYKPPTKAKQATQKVVPKPIIKSLEENKPIADDPNVVLTPEDLEAARAVITGKIPCELGSSVDIVADPAKEGYFTLTHEKVRYRMHPVSSRTGAVRLEDPRQEAMWLQLGNKSMLMSQKKGERLADECKAAAQVAVEEEMKKNPPKALFEGADAPKK